MDITFKTGEGRFNYRVCAVVIRDERLLIMQDDRCAYAYLPGGRVQMNEDAETAILREVREETGFPASILRPLWLGQAFFTEEQSGERFHEICVYYLLDGSLLPAASFIHRESDRVNRFEWIPFADLPARRFYPEFIKRRIFNLPEHPEILLEEQA